MPDIALQHPTLDKIFKEFDVDSNGRIDAAELKELAAKLGQAWSDEHATSVLAEIDEDGGGTIDMEEFKRWFLSQDQSGGGGGGSGLFEAVKSQVLAAQDALEKEIDDFFSSDEEVDVGLLEAQEWANES